MRCSSLLFAFTSTSALLLAGAGTAAAEDPSEVLRRVVFTRHGTGVGPDLDRIAADPSSYLPTLAQWLADDRIERAHTDRAEMPALANIITLLNLCGPDGRDLLKQAWYEWAAKRDEHQHAYDEEQKKLVEQLGPKADPAKVDPKVVQAFAKARRPIATYAALEKRALSVFAAGKWESLVEAVTARLRHEPMLLVPYLDYLDVAAWDRKPIEKVLREMLPKIDDPVIKKRIERWLYSK